MWNGSRPGPRGGMPFRGDPRGEMFDGRDGPMPDFRGRDGMNMGFRPQDRPPMDMRRFDFPQNMRGRDMDPLPMDMRGRDPPRDFFRPGDEPDMSLRRRYEMELRNNMPNTPGFMGQGRQHGDMGGRDMPPRNARDVNERFMDVRERERFQMDRPGFNMSPMDVRSRGPMEPFDRNDNLRGLRDRDRPRMGMDDIDGFSMDAPLRDRGMMDFDRRGGAPPVNPRGRFESDIDLRNRMGPSGGDFRDRSPLTFRDNDGVPMDSRGRQDMPPDLGNIDRPSLRSEPTLRDREFPEPGDGHIGFRSRENESLAEEWRKHGVRDASFPPLMGRDPRDVPEGRFLPGRGRENDVREPPKFPERDRPLIEFPGKGDGLLAFPRPERDAAGPQNWEKNAPMDGFPSRDSPKSVQKAPLLPLAPPVALPDGSAKPWVRDQGGKPDRNTSLLGRPPYLLEKNLPTPESRFQVDRAHFKGPKDMTPDQGSQRGSLMPGPKDLPSNSGGQRRDQDYRDIDYRTASGRKFDLDLGSLPGPEKDLKEPKQGLPPRLSDSTSKDQDYRNGAVQDKVSKTISISGIPKTATMQQILGAFAVRDGVPMQGMKIRNVVPGYSYDTAYVEFLNLEDAVHFMESNQGSVKVGSKTALLKYIQPSASAKEEQERHHEPSIKPPLVPQEPLLPSPVPPQPPAVKEDVRGKNQSEPLSQGAWQRNSTLTPEAWQQQVDQQLQQQQQEAEQETEAWANHSAPRHSLPNSDPIFKESKTMIIKNVKPTTTVETILKALDPYAYLDERNVRLVKGKPPGSKCFCFVDMDSHEQVTRLVELLTKPRPIMIDGVRVYAEVAKPLKNQNYRKDYEKSSTSLLGYPPDIMEQQQQQQQSFTPPTVPPMGIPTALPGGPMLTAGGSVAVGSDPLQAPGLIQGVAPAFPHPSAVDQSFPPVDPQAGAMPDPLLAVPSDAAGPYAYDSDTPDLSAYLYDATSGFYYDPQTTLYYDPTSRYFYNAQTQQYLYWDNTSKTYIPVPGSGTESQDTGAADAGVPMAAVAEATPTAAAPAVQEEEGKKVVEGAPEKRGEEEEAAQRSEKKEKDKEEKPRSLAAFKIMKDMERWAKIQNRQKESVRSPSPVLKTGGSSEDRKTSKAADAAFAVFERKGAGGDDLFKKPLAPPKKDEKAAKRPMGSLGMLAADYGAGSDEEEEEKTTHEAPRPPKAQALPQEKEREREDKLTDWKKMACLLCRRQFPNKDALLRHQQLSDLHKQNMEIHLKIKRSKRELEALENQEKEMIARESNGSPETKRRKQHSTWASGSRETHKSSERPGLGLDTTERKKKEPVVWNHATYKQAVRKAMFARFKELE
ncbi:RNA-binding protein 10 [Chanos chanos]|uniref:RNA-binding protein 10 n=1 Tax=Chanos chanos TaxID=29144 RepID=A0A6J2VKL5_CHACN|nr:RNA-binding protein 10-like [Chanos chanos]